MKKYHTMTNTGKSLKFFILAFWFIALNSYLYCQVHDLESSVKNFIEPADEGFLINYLEPSSHPARFVVDSIYTISSEFAYHDILRSWKNDNLLLSSNQYDANISSRLPFSYKGFPGLAILNFGYGSFSMQEFNTNNAADISLNNWPLYIFSGTVGLKANKHSFGLSWQVEYSATHSEVIIKHYYHDPVEDLLNRYFLDLLYPTFGEKIEFEPTHEGYSLSGEYVFSVNNNFSSGLLFVRQITRDNNNFSYINRTDRLAGQKKLNGSVDGSAYSVDWANEYFLDNLTIRMNINFRENNVLFLLKAINPSKSGDIVIDIKDLADSTFYSNNLGAGFGADWHISQTKELSFSIAAGNTSVKGLGDIKTPVLGLEIIPIAHQFEGKFTLDLASWSYQLKWSHNFSSGFIYGIKAGYLDGTAVLFYDNLAKMQFGIGTSHLKDKLKYRVRFYTINLDSFFPISENYSLTANIQQSLPDLKLLGKKKSVSAGRENKRKYWGGTIYKIGLQYQF